ncbi:MAG: hypothetical protein SFV19_11170 [Rhodospirillaceae bacterium]|nr:hypothetical protein [Rhodospirillaceae bacterium]
MSDVEMRLDNAKRQRIVDSLLSATNPVPSLPVLKTNEGTRSAEVVRLLKELDERSKQRTVDIKDAVHPFPERR